MGIRGNEAADALARSATRDPLCRFSVPHTDLKPKVQTYTKNLWQEDWNAQNENKLYQIRPDLKESLCCRTHSRKEESVLCRLHTGHSFYTHSYILKGNEPPWCIPCDVPITLKHILLDCWDLYDIRRKHFTADSIKVLFRDVPPDDIFAFLREINIFHLI